MSALQHIENVVSDVFGIKNLKNKTRKRHYVYARAVFFRITRDKTDLSLDRIGKHIGKDHATVMHGLKVFNNLIDCNDNLFFSRYKTCLSILNLDDNIDKQENLSKTILKLQKENTRLKTKLKEKSELDKSDKVSIEKMLYGLTDEQIQGVKDRLYPYIRICRDQNERNGYFIKKRNDYNMQSDS